VLGGRTGTEHMVRGRTTGAAIAPDLEEAGAEGAFGASMAAGRPWHRWDRHVCRQATRITNARAA
jgi:hypothetical protein